MLNEIFEHKVIFEQPLKLDGNNTWVQHIPFAFFLVSAAKPKTIVELGVHTGESYFAFCQAVKFLALDARCYGVDSWQGDPHTGYYGDAIYQYLLTHEEENYKGISHLLKMMFDEAISKFDDKSIDLLHIDGYHTYEAVKHDFECWLPKVRENGLILFHDTIVREREFGVWKFWEEISGIYPSVEFKFCNGLGCLVVDKERKSDISKLIEKIDRDTDTKLFFDKLGGKNLLIGEILRLKYQLQEKERTSSRSADTMNY
jgi:O-antigen biosynthesis protein